MPRITEDELFEIETNSPHESVGAMLGSKGFEYNEASDRSAAESVEVVAYDNHQPEDLDFVLAQLAERGFHVDEDKTETFEGCGGIQETRRRVVLS